MPFGDQDHAASVGGNEARQQIGEADFPGFHRVAAGGEFEAGLGELTDALSIGAIDPEDLVVGRRRCGLDVLVGRL